MTISYLESVTDVIIMGKNKKNLVCKLTKSLHDLKQAPRCWYRRFDSFILSLGFTRCEVNYCAYFQSSSNGGYIILLLYVDDMLVTGTGKEDIEML